MTQSRHNGVFDSTPIARRESPNYPLRELEAICFSRSMEVLAEEWSSETPARRMTNCKAYPLDILENRPQGILRTKILRR